MENGGNGSGGGCGAPSASSTDAIHDNDQVYMQKFRLYETRSVRNSLCSSFLIVKDLNFFFWLSLISYRICLIYWCLLFIELYSLRVWELLILCRSNQDLLYILVDTYAKLSSLCRSNQCCLLLCVVLVAFRSAMVLFIL